MLPLSTEDAAADDPHVRTDSELTEEFRQVFSNWVKACMQVKWHEEFPEAKLPAPPPLQPGQRFPAARDPLTLRTLPIGRLLRKFRDAPRRKYGYLPIMATHSPASIGAVAACSYSERINSQANRVSVWDNTKMNDDVLSKLVALRMNRGLFEEMCTLYGREDVEPILQSIMEEDARDAADVVGDT